LSKVVEEEGREDGWEEPAIDAGDDDDGTWREGREGGRKGGRKGSVMACRQLDANPRPLLSDLAFFSPALPPSRPPALPPSRPLSLLTEHGSHALEVHVDGGHQRLVDRVWEGRREGGREGEVSDQVSILGF